MSILVQTPKTGPARHQAQKHLCDIEVDMLARKSDAEHLLDLKNGFISVIQNPHCKQGAVIRNPHCEQEAQREQGDPEQAGGQALTEQKRPGPGGRGGGFWADFWGEVEELPRLGRPWLLLKVAQEDQGEQGQQGGRVGWGGFWDEVEEVPPLGRQWLLRGG